LPNGFLDRVHCLQDAEETRRLYHDWAEAYDEEMARQGYAAPLRCAEALAQLVPDIRQSVLDLGCGTGLSGRALREAGFGSLDGTDICERMIEIARSRDIYRRTFLHDLSHPLPLPVGSVANIAAVAALGPGHLPPDAIDHALRALAPDGLLAFTLDDHARQNAAYEGRVHAWIDSGAAELLLREAGPHLPGVSVEALVYVIRRCR